VLKVISTDPGAKRDFEAFARQTGNELIAQSQAGDALSFYIMRR
jgi:TusA-related sulfurtransferase